MTTHITTASGARYEWDRARGRIRRLEGDSGNTKRRDGDWLLLLDEPFIAVGYRARLLLEPLGDGDVTARVTTTVTHIQEGA